MTNSFLHKVNMLKQQLGRLKESYVLRQPMNLVLQMKQRLDELAHTLVVGVGHIIKLNREEFNTLTGKLDALSPLAVLSRGYSITFKAADGKVVKAAKALQKGDQVETRLSKGRFISIVEKITGGQE
jgi:exodeoxyribonuclease VII large subunit